ncbi:MAG: glycosyltransferase [Armatimonadota bacterium]|nr:glycosyltransferase [Armatimonadota bacterium]
MRSLKILNVSQVYLPNGSASGQAVKVDAISRHLAEHGHRVTVLTASAGFGATPVRCKTVDVVCLRSVIRYRAHSIAPGVARYCLDTLRSFDVVHLYGTYDLLGPVVAAFCRRWRVPYVLEPLGMFRPIVRNIGPKRAYRRLLGWPVVAGAARVIATSELEREELVADGVPAAKVVVRRNGVEPPGPEEAPSPGAFRRDAGVGQDQPLVLYLGRISKIKGLDLLLEAFSAVPAPAALAIVGPDDGDGCLQELERQRDRLGLNGRVRIMGPRFGADKWAALADADVVVLPSRSENFGNAAAEAVACGVPVVVTDRCGIAPLVADRAGLVVPCHVDAIRYGLSRLLEDPDLRERLRAGALEVRRDLSWDEPVARQEQIYLEVLREHSHRSTAFVPEEGHSRGL